MIREITNYVLGSYECSTIDNFSIKGNIIYEFDYIPTLNDIKKTCIKWCNDNYPDYEWINCTMTYIEFLSKSAFENLNDNNNETR